MVSDEAEDTMLAAAANSSLQLCELEVQAVLDKYRKKFAYHEVRVNGLVVSGEIVLVEDE